MHAGEHEIADAGERDGDGDHRARAEAIDAIAGDGTFDGALGAGEGKYQRSRRARQSQFMGHRQKKHRQSIGVQAAAENADRATDGDHAPAEV